MRTQITSSAKGNMQMSLFPEVKQEITRSAKEVRHSPEVFYQYLLLISPPSTIKQKVKGMKITLNRTIGLSNENLHSIAHISLVSFHSSVPMSEHTLIAMQQVFSQSASFNIRINDFDSFEHANSSKTIYAKVEGEEPIRKIQGQLCELFNLPLRSFVPHVSVARSIDPASADKGLRIVKNVGLKDQFLCNKITVLERKLQNGTFSNYKVYHEIKLR